MARVTADTHLHLHGCHETPRALGALAANLRRAGGDVLAGLLAERAGSGAFEMLRRGALAAAPYVVRPAPETGGLLLLAGEEPPLHLFAGRQVVTRERVEVLSLCAESLIPDGMAAAAAVEAILAAGGVPVLPWSPGKWLGSRGRLVRELLEARAPGEILIGDTVLRPAGSPEPRLMREARRRGFSVAAGSDPLPLPGEERYCGAYAAVLEGPFDPERPVSSMRALLRSPRALAGAAGRRNAWGESAARWLRNRRATRG